MKTTHTPGPWKTWHSGYANAPFVVYSGENKPSLNHQGQLLTNGSTSIAHVKHDESPDYDMQVANARLIAAAPDLLKALQEVEMFLRAGVSKPGRDELLVNVLEVISKAQPHE